MNATIRSLKRIPAMLGCALMLGAAMPNGSAVAASVPESTDPIKLAMNEWSSQNILTQIAGKLLTKMGYNVEYVTAGYTVQMMPLAAGELTASMEIWEVNVGEGFSELVEKGEIEVIGETGLEGGGGWVYPAFAEEMCPGLPDYEALKDCAQLFATAETLPQGRLVDFPPEWGNMYTQERIEALGLDFKPVSGGSEGAMQAELRSSVSSGNPALVYFWWPHPIFAELDLKVVDLPAYEDGCYTDPQWGINPDETYDCGEGPGRIVKIAWPGMKDKWPAAYRLLKEFKIGNEEDMEMAYAVEGEGRDAEDVADEWIAENEAVWQGWIDSAMPE